MERRSWITTGVVAVAILATWTGCDFEGSADQTIDGSDETSDGVEQIAIAARTPPVNPDNDGQAQDCLSRDGVTDDNGRVHNRFLWCKRATIKVRPWVPR